MSRKEHPLRTLAQSSNLDSSLGERLLQEFADSLRKERLLGEDVVVVLAREKDVNNNPENMTFFDFAEFKFDSTIGLLTSGEMKAVLTTTEASIFKEYCLKPNRGVSNIDVCRKVWGHEDKRFSGNVKTYVKRIRGKLGAVGLDSKETLRSYIGFGYGISSTTKPLKE